jgi:2-phosphoglycerate kinase
MENEWNILFIGGTSGAGKTTLATELGSELEIDVVSVDAF